MKASPPTWQHHPRLDIINRWNAILKVPVTLEYTWTTNRQLTNQLTLPTWGTKGTDMPARCTQCIPAHKHLTVCAGNTVTAGAGVPAPCIMCLCCRGLSVSFQLLNRWNDEASFSDLFSRQIMSKGSVCTFKYLYTKEYIYICVDKTKKIF